MESEHSAERDQLLLRALGWNDDEAPGYDSEMHCEAMGYLRSLEQEHLDALPLTVENTRALLTEWGHDPVNEGWELAGLYELHRLPREIIEAHAEGILSHLDNVVDDQYGWHENYPALWESVVQPLARICPRALQGFVEKTMLPRLIEAADDYAQEAEGKDPRPSLFQDSLLDTCAQLGGIALAGKDGAAVLAPVAERLRAVVEKAWADFERQGMYMELVRGLRVAIKSPDGVAAAMGKSEGNKDSEDHAQPENDVVKKPYCEKTVRVRDPETRRTTERPEKKARAGDCEDPFAAGDGY